ncbi:RNA polymerase sigma factor [Evansella tamaricis]|uniref:RNA polymerase sigma factor n=1 Tax=Evansella tamaricis TaxID=2069301 RepID=A0ABS6JFT8_9BACI|nr:RNA polymerase sigma factor [Evansella tamaricis]MBU9712547.1 RNA polymerase sigma factor [Evansella tamaricis]
MKLEELYKEIQPSIYAFFYVKTMNKEIAEDMTQEVFYQAIKNYNTYSGKSTLKTWTFSIAKNILLKHFRTNKYKGDLATKLQNEMLLQTTESLETQIIQKEKRLHLIHLINKLDEVTKEIVTLRIYGELSFHEIGQLIGKSENYSRITFHRAKLKLQKELEKYE